MHDPVNNMPKRKRMNRDQIKVILGMIVNHRLQNFRVLFRKNDGDIRYMKVSRMMSCDFVRDMVTVYDEEKEDIRRFKISNVYIIERNLENPPLTLEQMKEIVSQVDE